MHDFFCYFLAIFLEKNNFFIKVGVSLLFFKTSYEVTSDIVETKFMEGEIPTACGCHVYDLPYIFVPLFSLVHRDTMSPRVGISMVSMIQNQNTLDLPLLH